MLDSILFNENGSAAKLLLRLETFEKDDKKQIPPFESEALKAEEKAGEDQPLLSFGKEQIILIAGFAAFQFFVLWLNSR